MMRCLLPCAYSFHRKLMRRPSLGIDYPVILEQHAHECRSSRMNADDRLSPDALGPVEGGNGIVEGNHVPDVCPQTTIPNPRTSSLNWARSGTTTKSIVRPSVGRASVGPAMVTSVPPVRITPADRFANRRTAQQADNPCPILGSCAALEFTRGWSAMRCHLCPYSSLGYQSVPRPEGVKSSISQRGSRSGAPRGSCPGSAIAPLISPL